MSGLGLKENCQLHLDFESKDGTGKDSRKTASGGAENRELMRIRFPKF